VFQTINLARCDLSIDFFERINSDKLFISYLTTGLELLDLGGNRTKLKSDLNFVLTSMLLHSHHSLKYIDISSIKLDDASESSIETFVSNLKGMICNSPKLEIIRL
jgi:hypothetical protein